VQVGSFAHCEGSGAQERGSVPLAPAPPRKEEQYWVPSVQDMDEEQEKLAPPAPPPVPPVPPLPPAAPLLPAVEPPPPFEETPRYGDLRLWVRRI